MEATESNKTPNLHPLQGCVTRIIPLVGIITALILNLLIIISIYLMVDSAFVVNENLGGMVSFITLIYCSILGYVYFLTEKSGMIIIVSSGNVKLDKFTPIYLTLIFCGFIQIIFWVIDSGNNIHEPRSVFIIACGAIIAYFRQKVTEQNIN
jgi:uncharacterized membrane protein